MVKYEVSLQNETMLDESTMLPFSTVSGSPVFRSLLEDKPTLAMIYLAFLIFICSWGGTTNIVVLVVHIKNKRLNKAGRIFLVNLAITDIWITLGTTPFCIIGVTHGDEYYQRHPELCQFVGSFCFSVCICAILNLALASINRYMYVCQKQIYLRFFNNRISLGVAIVTWILSLIVGFGNILAWSGYIFDKKTHSCVWDRMANFNFTIFVSVVMVISPITTIVILNILLLRRIHATKFDICMMHDIASMRTKRNAWIETLRASRTLFSMCIVFMICWFPYAITIAFDTSNTYSEEVYLFVTLLAHAHSSTTFLLYWICNKEFSKTVSQFLPNRFNSCYSLSELPSSSFHSSDNNPQIPNWYFCCQSKEMSQHHLRMTSTSDDTIRTDMDKDNGADSFKRDNSITEKIYTLKQSASSNVTDF